MKSKTSKVKNSEPIGMKYLYWKISAALLSLLVLLGLVYVFITGFIAQEYLQETNQMLYGGIAKSMTKEVDPFEADGTFKKEAIQEIMHSMMVTNPSIEVYLLNPAGKILTYVSPYKEIEIESVDLGPVKTFLAKSKVLPIKGDDPRFAGQKNVFSTAPIMDEEKLLGYWYVILASQKEAAVAADLIHCYIPKLGIQLFALTLIGALIIGLIAIWFLTKNLRQYAETVTRFQEGDLKARVCENTKGDFPILADTFNAMADTIVANIEELKSVESLRKELIANVSHDLRTPLAIMQGYVETLLMKEDNISTENRQKYLNIILNSSEKLAALIKQLFEYSKLEARQIEPQKEPFQLTDLVQDAFAKYEVIAKDKNITVKVAYEKDLPIVFADISLVERVIQNLMDNALKFTPQSGTITIELKELKNGVQFKVADTGPGIPKDEQAFIFDRYRKINKTARQTANNGAGLGLAIVKKILELHNANIRVQSRLNEGTAFTFALPTYVG